MSTVTITQAALPVAVRAEPELGWRGARFAPARGLDSGRIASLDGLRAVSILLVMLFHVAKTANSPVPAGLYWYASQGAVGVDVFFVISGFLITTLLMRERERTGTISLRGFYGRRALRILPAFAGYLAVMGLFSQAGWIHLAARDWVAAGTYTVNFFRGISIPFGHLWSLSVEEHFYLVWPPIFVLLGARRSALLVLAVLAVGPFVRSATHRFAGDQFDIDFATFTRLDGIAAGCLLAIAGHEGRAWWLTALEARPRLWFAVGSLVLGVSVLALGRSGKYSIGPRPLMNAVAICVIVWTAIRAPGPFYARVLKWAPLAWVGRLSYSLYLWQQVFLDPSNEERWMCRFPQNLALAMGAAVTSYYLIERPFLALKRRSSRPVCEIAPEAALAAG